MDISEDVTVTVGPLSETITMVEKGKKDEKWEYKRPKHGTGDIKNMTIDWKKGKFDIRMDKADLAGVTNPVTISIQIGDDVGEETIEMKVKKHHWDYKAKVKKAPGLIAAVAKSSLPKDYALYANYPNPFNPETWIPYALADAEHVMVKIYALSGKLVRTLDLGQKIAGSYIAKDKAAYWDGRNEFGEKVSSGVYFYNLQASDYNATKRMLILK